MKIEEIRRLHYMEEGREEVWEEGRKEIRKQLILSQYKKGLSIEFIAEINDFDVKYVNEIVKDNTVF